MKEKFLFGMLNDDYRESVLKENEMKKVRANIREKSRLKKLNESNKKHLKESVNINVSADGNVNVNNDKVNINIEEQSAPIVTEPIPVEEPEVEEPKVEEVQEEIIEEGCKTCESCGKPISECSCGKSKKEAEAIVKNPKYRGDIEFQAYIPILKDVAKMLIQNVDEEGVGEDRQDVVFGIEDTHASDEDAYVYAYIKPTESIPGEKEEIPFGLGVSDSQQGAPYHGEKTERFLQFWVDDGSENAQNGEVNEEIKFSTDTPIAELRKDFYQSLCNSEGARYLQKKIGDYQDLIKYREDNNITDSEKLKESEAEEIGEDVINSVVSKIAAEDAELADKIKEILSKDSEEPETEEITEEPLEECEISSYKVTRIAPNSNAYMLEAQTKDGLKYIIGKNFNETEKTLDEAEILDNKKDASNKFRSLLK